MCIPGKNSTGVINIAVEVKWQIAPIFSEVLIIFFWHTYSLNTELEEEETNKIAKCYKKLYIKKVVSDWERLGH